MMKKLMFSMAVISTLNILGCTPILMDKLDVRPSKTTVTYGKTLTDKSDEDKDVQKDAFTVKQEFLWE